MSADVTSEPIPVFTRDLFNRFNNQCGGCHVETALGDFQVDFNTFPELVDVDSVERMLEDDMLKLMPPPPLGVPVSERGEGDPTTALAADLQAWIDAGRPPSVRFVEPPPRDDLSPFLLAPEVGTALSNLGNCVPDRRIVATEEARIAELDATFATMTELPKRLEETDLFTFEAEELARHGVVAYQTAYPLWSDDAAKLRQIRLPAGETIVFDPETQEFSVPANTRVYKTFLKEVIDETGNKAYRKIETRIIVARPDRMLEDGSLEPTAIYGTYVWNEEETEAILLEDRLRNGELWADRFVTYFTDEPAAEAVLATGRPDAEEVLRRDQLQRTYAVPAKERCLQCHMGAPNFLLGLSPLQLNLKDKGESGSIDERGADELNQLQRLIDYGLITGMASADEALPLELTQGDRVPRNDYELKAQGYILGNCAHCHNPRGFPSVENPELRDALNFRPGPEGGIFQFPLDKTSPRIRRGERLDVEIPYITPSLREIPRFENGPHDKYFFDVVNGANQRNYIDAPWRSLMYRNVDTPFSYSDDFAIYPKMPFHVPGHDCRAPMILGEWMVSIPSKRKFPLLSQDSEDFEPQPYTEVKPDDPDYGLALLEAEGRLAVYRNGERFADFDGDGTPDFCPDTRDIVDAKVLAGGSTAPGDATAAPSVANRIGSGNPRLNLHKDGVPDQPHWAPLDLTEVVGDWNPRRTDWKDFLVPDPATGIPPSADTVPEAEQLVIGLLQDARLTEEFRAFALEKVPFGFWQEKPQCDLSGVPRLSEVEDRERTHWLEKNPGKPADSPVFMEAPGETVFNQICQNCHGRLADSNGQLASTILDITGGATRVANLRDGLFGQAELMSNVELVFGPVGDETPEATTEDWAVRYTAWMALGGTLREIPTAVLELVANASVMGRNRGGGTSNRVEDANMLETARRLCRDGVLPGGSRSVRINVREGVFEHSNLARGTPLVEANGDAEMWQALCSFGQDIPVRGVTSPNWANPELNALDANPGRLYAASAYPSDAPVGRSGGGVEIGVQPDNVLPWCLELPKSASDRENALEFAEDKGLPVCPEELVQSANRWSPAQRDAFAAQGAINAGMAVYVFLEAFANGAVDATPRYNECELLGGGN